MPSIVKKVTAQRALDKLVKNHERYEELKMLIKEFTEPEATLKEYFKQNPDVDELYSEDGKCKATAAFTTRFTFSQAKCKELFPDEFRKSFETGKVLRCNWKAVKDAPDTPRNEEARRP